jgi:hypothetical protein
MIDGALKCQRRKTGRSRSSLTQRLLFLEVEEGRQTGPTISARAPLPDGQPMLMNSALHFATRRTVVF